MTTTIQGTLALGVAITIALVLIVRFVMAATHPKEPR